MACGGKSVKERWLTRPLHPFGVPLPRNNGGGKWSARYVEPFAVSFFVLSRSISQTSRIEIS